MSSFDQGGIERSRHWNRVLGREVIPTQENGWLNAVGPKVSYTGDNIGRWDYYPYPPMGTVPAPSNQPADYINPPYQAGSQEQQVISIPQMQIFTPPKSLKICPQCCGIPTHTVSGASVVPNYLRAIKYDLIRYCSDCGKELFELVCPGPLSPGPNSCGTLLDETMGKFCTRCGTNLHYISTALPFLLPDTSWHITNYKTLNPSWDYVINKYFLQYVSSALQTPSTCIR